MPRVLHYDYRPGVTSVGCKPVKVQFHQIAMLGQLLKEYSMLHY